MSLLFRLCECSNKQQIFIRCINALFSFLQGPVGPAGPPGPPVSACFDILVIKIF